MPTSKRAVVARARVTLDALEHLVGRLGTAVLALIALFGAPAQPVDAVLDTALCR